MQRASNFKAISRTVAVIAAVLIVVSGITYAALQSQPVKLTGNSIETATANLRISTDGLNFGNTQPGFDFKNILPGGPADPEAGDAFYLNNSGGTSLALRLAVAAKPSNPDNVDLSQVNVILTAVGLNGTQTFNLQSLIDGADNGGVAFTGANLPSDTIQEYKLQVSMASDAISGSSASLGGIDFAFSGFVQAN